MKKIRLSVFLMIAAAVGAGAGLFLTSQQVQTQEAALRNLRESLQSEKDTIRVLRAEWAYLTRPERLEKLAADHLKMALPSTDHLAAGASDLPDSRAPVVPGRKPVMVAVPAVMTTSPPPSSSVPAPPPASPLQTKDKKDFQGLLNQLSDDEGGVR